MEKHKHELGDLQTEAVQLRDRNGTNQALWDIFTYKVCACGFKAPVNVERTSKRPTQVATQ